jgi:hypothetical protein
MGISDAGAIEAYKGRLITQTSKEETRSWRLAFVSIIAIVGGFFLGSVVLMFHFFWDEVTSGWYLCFPAMFIGGAVLVFLLIVPFLLGTGEFAIYQNGVVMRTMVTKRTFYPWMSFKGYRLVDWGLEDLRKIELYLKDDRELFINPTMDRYEEALAIIQDRLVDLGPAEGDEAD